jgi:hypothetical protein
MTDHPMPVNAGRPVWRGRLKRALPGAVSVLFHVVLALVLIRFAVARGTLTPQPDVEFDYVKDEPFALDPAPEPSPADEPRNMDELPRPPELAAAPEPEIEAPALQSDVEIPRRALSDLPLVADASWAAVDARKGGTAFGFSDRLEGDLVGTMYDLKRDARGAPRVSRSYVEDVRTILGGRMKPQAFSGFHRLPRRLYLSHLFVPYGAATTGPAAFGVQDLMEPTQWVVHYTGELQPRTGGRFRFVGMFDDLLVVAINGRTVLEFLWTGDPSPWAPSDFVDAHPCFAGKPLVYGDWVALPDDQPTRIDILVGEHPGGRVGGVLLLQQEGVQYPVEANGRPILPLFTMMPLSAEERERVRTFAEWKFDPGYVTMAPGKPPAAAAPQRARKEERDVTVRIL